MLKRFLKNERGLTLIELLAVVVILGIIAAIAVPSIGGIIDNTKKDAHIANANQMISAAKIALAGDNTLVVPTGTAGLILSLDKLEDDGYLETLEDPDGGSGYVKTGTDAATYSYVKITKTTAGAALKYEVQLVGSERKVVLAEVSAIDRTKVVPK